MTEAVEEEGGVKREWGRGEGGKREWGRKRWQSRKEKEEERGNKEEEETAMEEGRERSGQLYQVFGQRPR